MLTDNETAASQLLNDLQRWGLNAPESLSEYDCAHALIDAAIAKRHPLAFCLGTFYNDEMEEKPWHALMWPKAFQNSAQGLRVKCDVEHLGERPLIYGAEQMDGTRIILLSKIDAIWLAE